MVRALELTGQTFGRLKVIRRNFDDTKGQSKWECVCECGNKTIVTGSRLKSGKTRSCGCLNLERITKHNLLNTPEYSIWCAMKQRCYNPNFQQYKDYGGRGIKICDSWKDDYSKFYKDMGPRPSKNHSIERIDVNGNYSPDNCKWATISEQSRNKRKRPNKTGHTGVYLDTRNNTYYAMIYKNNKSISVGSGLTLEQAIMARKRAEKNIV